MASDAQLSFVWGVALHCSEAGRAASHLLSEEERAIFVRMYAFLLNNMQEHKHCHNR